MNIYWEEHDSSEERPKHWSEDKTKGTVDLSGASATVLIPPTPEVGGYDITGGNGKESSIVFNFVKKPSWFHRTCCRFFLGWKWNDKKENKEKKLLFG